MEKEEQLQSELDTTKHVSRAKDQQISVLEQELQANKVKMTSLSDQFHQQQRELEMLQQKGKWNIDGVCVCDCIMSNHYPSLAILHMYIHLVKS